MDAGPSFHNVDPRSREERHMAGSEKVVRQRQGQAGPPPGNPILPVKGSPQFADEYTRFARDAAAHEYQQRQAGLAAKESLLEQKRVENYHREKSRWDNMQNGYQSHEQSLAHKRDNGAGGARRNASGEHYNILTLEHKATPEGERLKQKDQAIMRSADQRAHNLYAKNQSVSHNIITGQPLQYPQPAYRNNGQ